MKCRVLVRAVFVVTCLVSVGWFFQKKLSNKQDHDQKIELCLRELFSSDLGYTLIGCKPISFLHCSSIKYDNKTKSALFEFLQTTFSKSRKYIIRIGEIPCYSRFSQITLVHKKALLETIAREPLLRHFIRTKFKTNECFFRELAKQETDVFSLFSDNEVLLGIVLGYGRRNSLFFQERLAVGNYLNKFHIMSRVVVTKTSFIWLNTGISFRRSEPQYDTKKFSSLEQYWEWIRSREVQPIFFHPPILIEIPGFIACKGKESRKIFKRFQKARNSLANLFCGKTYKEILIEKARD